MTNQSRKLLSIYIMPGIVLLLFLLPGLNSYVFFEHHAIFGPIVGILCFYCLPFCTPYVMFRLVRLVIQNHRPLSLQQKRDDKEQTNAKFFTKYGMISLLTYLAVLYPLSFFVSVSLNWSRTWNLNWDPFIFYKLITFPVGFLVPPWEGKNSECLSFLFNVIGRTLK